MHLEYLVSIKAKDLIIYLDSSDKIITTDTKGVYAYG